jgi:hypothetical protein
MADQQPSNFFVRPYKSPFSKKINKIFENIQNLDYNKSVLH